MTSALRRRRGQRTLVAFAAGVIGLAVLPVLSLAAKRTLENSKEGRSAIEGLLPLVLLPPTPGALLGVVDDQGEITSVALLALAPPRDGAVRGGTVVVVPAGAKVPLADGSVGRLASEFRRGGPDAFVAAAEGLLGVSVTSSLIADEATIGGLLAPYGPIDYQVSEPVVDADASGAEREVVAAGATSVDGATMGAVLAARRTADPEIVRFGRIGDLWSSLSLRVGAGLGDAVPFAAPADGAPAADPVADFPTFWRALFAGPVGVYRLTAEPVPAGDGTVDTTDLLQLNLAEVNLVTATVLPSSVSPPYPSITFYVRSPLGDPAATLTAVGRLLYGGGNVVLVKEDSSIPIPATTTIAYDDPADRAEAEKFAAYLRPDVTTVEPDTRIDGVDVIVTLGESFRAEVNAAPPTVPLPTPAPTPTEG